MKIFPVRRDAARAKQAKDYFMESTLGEKQ
jgi:hypothetical protein